MSSICIVRPITCFTFAFCLVAGMAAAQTTASPKDEKKPESTITLSTKPTPPAAGETTFTVTAKDANGKPITGADVSVEFVMPPMGGMAEMKNKVALKASTEPKLAVEGTYVGTGQIMMAGKWNVTIDVRVGGKSVAEKKLTVTAK
jgi:YtkA-like